ncbi:MAG: DUF2283 domain-containing protein [Euryarchaeota archaeon]|nr:DUF2283 domain-containing protein [Euryarchaeota archaeon]
MAQKMTVWYDPEADCLEFTVGPARRGYFKDAGDDVFQRVDARGNILGFAIFNFRKRGENGEVKVKLPVRLKMVRAGA